MKKCPNGHYYNDALPSCPYCSPDNSFDGFDQTEIPLDDADTTAGFDDQPAAPTPPPSSANETIPFGGNVPGTGTDLIGGGIAPSPFAGGGGSDMDKTIIIDHDAPSAGQEGENTRPNRKLVGWLVSYTLDELGMDFRLYEGKNVIGSDVSCDIAVLQDKSVSGRHATILFRNNKFLLRDELSTNGTFLNGEIVEVETPVLQDGDIIKVGNTVFKFRIAL